MMENVPALEHYDKFQYVVKELDKLGYNPQVKVLNVKDYEVPQSRKRLVMVGSILGNLEIAKPVNKKVTVRDTIENIESEEATSDAVHKIYPKHTERVMQRIRITPKNGGSRKDLPAEYILPCHKKENVGLVELATMSFGQSFQITPMQLLRATSAIINGGTLVTPHFAVKTTDASGENEHIFEYETVENAIDKNTSEIMKGVLKEVIENGGGINAYMENYSMGGKTATSQKLPRSAGKYISSFIGFLPVENPQLIAMCIIDEPVGVYYGGTIAAPVIKQLFENILPYMNIPEKNSGIPEDNLNTTGNN
jgi:cell division protein FtsI/penicillin-binding protein 2